MTPRDQPTECQVCGVRGLPSIADFDGQSIPKLPKTVRCSNCGTEYRLRKNMLAIAQRKNSFWADWVGPNLVVVLLTLGLAIIVMLPFFLLSKALAAVIPISIFKQVK